MFKLITAMMAILTIQAYAQNCSNVGRAVVTDQKNITQAIAFQFLGLEMDDVIEFGTSEYVSWKGVQVGCLANVYHATKFNAVVKNGANSRCEITIDVYAKDHFVNRTSFEREYKPRNVIKNCFTENEQQAAQSAQCMEMGACPRDSSGVKMMRDYNDDCSCKYATDMIDYEDKSAQYELFYNPAFTYPRPEGIPNLFN